MEFQFRKSKIISFLQQVKTKKPKICSQLKLKLMLKRISSSMQTASRFPFHSMWFDGTRNTVLLQENRFNALLLFSLFFALFSSSFLSLFLFSSLATLWRVMNADFNEMWYLPLFPQTRAFTSIHGVANHCQLFSSPFVWENLSDFVAVCLSLSLTFLAGMRAETAFRNNWLVRPEMICRQVIYGFWLRNVCLWLHALFSAPDALFERQILRSNE